MLDILYESLYTEIGGGIMSLGNHLFQARKKTGLSQELVAEKLGVSRQTISKWETDETVPDIYQSKKLAILYQVSLDELIAFDVELHQIETVIQNSDEEKEVRRLLNELKQQYRYNELEAMLVLKDILYHEWKDRKHCS